MTDDNVIYKRQFAILMFILTFTYKVSRLPPLVASEMDTNGTLLVFLYILLEMIMFFIIYRFILIDGHDTLKDTILYKIIMVILAIYFLMKINLMFTGTLLFSLELLFEKISPIEVTIAIIIPITYIAYKGIRAIGRTAEICLPLIFLVLFTNLVFLKANLDFHNNLPLLTGDFLDLLSDGDKFFFWFGDFTPLIFVKLKSKKHNYIGLSFILSFSLVMLAIVLMYALYGSASEYISNFIVKVAGYNQFATKLGRLDWTGMVCWLTMSIIYLSIYLWAFQEALSTIVKKKTPCLFVGVFATILLQFFVHDNSKIIMYALSDIRWFAVICNYILPLIILIYQGYEKKRQVSKNSILGGVSE